MGRKSRLNKKTPVAEPVRSLLKIIVEEIDKAAKVPFDDWFASGQFASPPPAIPISEGREYRITQTGAKAAHKLIDQIWKQRTNIRQTFQRPDFIRLSFRAIGDSIQSAMARLPEENVDGDASEEIEALFYQDLAADFKTILDGLLDTSVRDLDQHIPCELFHADQSVPAFEVGPVEFRLRSEWIERFIKDSKTRNIVERVERRELTFEEINPRNAEIENESALRNARTVLSFLRGYSWVGTVRNAGHEFGQSHWKTSILVDLAMSVIGLRFHPEHARRFTRAGGSYLGVEYRLATSANDGGFINGTSAILPGLGAAPGELATRMREERSFLDAAGTILRVYTEHRQERDAPILVERWVNSLYWVCEARREAHDFMAVVKYGCALDGITGGEGKSEAITKFVKAALGPREDEREHSGTLSLPDAVTMVYGEGRSKLAHGGIPGLLEDFSRHRRVGDTLLAILFHPVTLALAELIAENSRALTLSRNNAFRALQERVQNLRGDQDELKS